MGERYFELNEEERKDSVDRIIKKIKVKDRAGYRGIVEDLVEKFEGFDELALDILERAQKNNLLDSYLWCLNQRYDTLLSKIAVPDRTKRTFNVERAFLILQKYQGDLKLISQGYSDLSFRIAI